MVEAPAAPVVSPRKGWRRLLAIPTPILFGASILIALLLLWRQGTLADLAANLRRLHPATVVAAFALYAGGLGLLSARWHALVRMAGGSAPAAVSAEVFLTSVVVNYAAPIGLAVPTRAALSKRDLGLSASGSGALVLWEAVLDLGTLALIGGAWLLLGGAGAVGVLVQQGSGWVALGGAAAVAAVALLGAALIASGRLRSKLRRFSGEALGLPRRRPVAAVAAIGCTLAFWTLQAVILWLLLAGFGVSAPGASLVLGLLGWPVFVGMLSPVPGGAGVREALMVAVAGLERVDGAAVLLAAVTYRLALFAALPLAYGLARAWRAVGGRATGEERT
jgi:uncharacterized membrane protein YbhN (UPF0104 family)